MKTINGYDACEYTAIVGLTRKKFWRPVPMVFGYIDGPCKWPAEAWTAFRDIAQARQLFRITTEANPLAEVYDWERGTASLAEVTRAVRSRADVYLPSIVYVSKDNWPTAKEQLHGLPIAWWVADWTGKPHIPQGAAGCQFASYPNYDLSALLAGFPYA